ncbi:MAG: hypothetical protein BWY45_03350 [Euryarchaeota archaeon ADurb.Bin294]|nr:MAG: hypothetical protein BWY45_03350 [Euryarchaeota archaeon ADurb.Bin294]
MSEEVFRIVIQNIQQEFQSGMMNIRALSVESRLTPVERKQVLMIVAEKFKEALRETEKLI